MKKNGSTTVAATMYLAHLAGLKLFVTGGIGGVHRGADKTFDISADLTELARTPVTVVSAGIKSILDVGKTVEVLETLGVPLLTYQSDTIPDFFFSSSEFKSPMRVENGFEAAAIITQTKNLLIKTGTLVTVPIPSENEEDKSKIKSAIDQAVRESE